MTAQEEYRDWCKNREQDLSIFLRSWWLDAVCLNDWDVSLHKNKDGKIIGALPYFQFKKKMIDVIGMPFLTPYMGIFLQFPAKQKLSSTYDFEKEVVSQLISQLPSSTYLQQKFYPEYIYGLPFFWKGFQLDWRYTYHLSLQQSEQAIWEGMEGSARTQLQKTMKLVKIETSDNTKVLYELVSMTFSKQSLNTPYSFEEFERLYNAVKEHECGEIYLAKLLENDMPVAGMFMVKDNGKVYNLVLGRDHNLDPGGSIHGILWKCIQDQTGMQDVFDFEGSMLEGPERMFRSFGSTRVPVLQVTRYRNRLWKAILAFAGK